MTPEQEQLILEYIKQVANDLGVDLEDIVTTENLKMALTMLKNPILRTMLGAYLHD